MTKDVGELIAARLNDRIDLEGTYALVPRQEDPNRFIISPAYNGAGGYRAVVGRDRERGRITVLINKDGAVVMLDATTAPL